MSKSLKNIDRSIVYIFIMNLGTLMLFVMLFYPRFYSDLDILMQSAVYGIADVHSSYILFSNVLIGKGLTILMGIVPMIPWYIVFHYVCAFVSLFIITLVIKKRNDTVMGNVLIGIVLAFLGFECYAEPNYMKTAVVLCVAAVALLFSYYEEKEYIQIVVSAGLAVASSMISFRIFFVSGSMSLILLSIYVLKTKFQKKELLSMLGIVVVVVILSLGARWFDIKMYESSGKEYVLTYRDSIEKILGYGSPEGEDALYEKYNLDEKQYEALSQGYFSNIDDTNFELLKAISLENKGFSGETIKEFFRDVPIALFERGVLYYLIVLSFLYVLVENRKLSVLAITWGAILIEYFILYIQNAWECKWVGFVVMVPASLYILFHMKNLESAELKTILVYMAILGIVLYSNFSSEIASKVNDEPMVSVYEEVEKLDADILLIDMVDYLREYSGFQVYDIPYVPEDVYFVNGGYGLIKPYVAWTKLTDLSGESEWLYNPEKIKVNSLFHNR